MIDDIYANRYPELERRMRTLEEEVEGEKAVTRYVLTQARLNGDDLIVMKATLSHVSDDMVLVKATLQSQGTRLNGLTQDATLLRQDVTHLRRDMEELRVHMDAKFDAIDARFDAMGRSIDAVLEAVRALGPRDAGAGA
jgi:uncharacterized protein YoxC